MSPRPYQPQWRHEISPQQQYNQQPAQYPYAPQFVTPYNHGHNPYYGTPCNMSNHYQYSMIDAAEAARPNKKSKVDDRSVVKPPVPGKGLKHFSLKICERVKSMGSTSYNEVADLLIKELREDEAKAYAATAEPAGAAKKSKRTKPPQSKYDEKNIRRRVYDALNVLMAMDIIVKDKKMIVWNGLPGERTIKPHVNVGSAPPVRKEKSRPSEQLLKLQEERSKRQAEVQRKREILQELITQNVCFNNLYQRNHAREVAEMTTSQDNAVKTSQEEEKIPLPFIVVNTSHSTVIQCEMCPNKTSVNLDFTNPFEINDDNEILKKLGMDRISGDALGKMLPPDMMEYCGRKGMLNGVVSA